MLKLDTKSEFGARVMKRLQDEQIIWLTTVRPDGIPQPNPVWFLFDGEAILIYSQPGARKVSHIGNNPKVALNFNTTADGGDVVVITGEASIDTQPLPAEQAARYLEKYRQGIPDIGMTPDSYMRSFSTVIRVIPKHVRGM
jgi:PPOX class probable F420-dependent enzyme